MTLRFKHIVWLIGINFLYASVIFFTKFAASHPFASRGYIAGFAGAVAMMGVYAVLWQQVLKVVELTTAYMFKGTTIIFALLFATVFFGETVSWNNLLGAAIIITGIALFAKQ